MGTLLHDVRYAARVLLRQRGFTLAAVFVVALGIGATTAIFSVVYGVPLKPLNFTNYDRLMAIGEFNARQGSGPTELSFPNLSDLQKQSNSFEGVAAYHSASYGVEFSGAPSRVTGTTVSSNLFHRLPRFLAAQLRWSGARGPDRDDRRPALHRRRRDVRRFSVPRRRDGNMGDARLGGDDVRDGLLLP